MKESDLSPCSYKSQPSALKCKPANVIKAEKE